MLPWPPARSIIGVSSNFCGQCGEDHPIIFLLLKLIEKTSAWSTARSP